MYKRVPLSGSQKRVMEEAFVSFMMNGRFFAYYFYDQMEVYYTTDIETCATDGRRIFVNPVYMETLNPLERCFALCHEVYHVIYRHCSRMATYKARGELRGLPFSLDFFNVSADWVINADLIRSAIGQCNPSWLYRPDVSGDELVEDVYCKFFPKMPPPPPQEPCDDGDEGEGGQGSGQGKGTQSGPAAPGTTYGETGQRKGGKRDQTADQQSGRFDSIMVPQRDGSGKDDLPSEVEFREAIARAEAATRGAGDMPGGLKRVVREILTPQVQWREHLRLKVTGRIGARRENWASPNRRRIALPDAMFAYLPSRQGFGAELITVVIDNSGSIGNRELTVFFSEAAAIFNDCRPKRVQLMWCDQAIKRVDEARSLDELLHIREAPGGGGTSFKPPFRYLEERNMVPDALVYLTDMDCYGDWPEEPKFPVIWCAITDVVGPWGETVRVRVND